MYRYKIIIYFTYSAYVILKQKQCNYQQNYNPRKGKLII